MKKASASELVIMDILWTANKPLSRSEIAKITNSSQYNRNWEDVTVSTFVARLEAKGLVKYARKANITQVYPTMGRDEYIKKALDLELDKKTGHTMYELILEYLDLEYNDINVNKLINCLNYLKA